MNWGKSDVFRSKIFLAPYHLQCRREETRVCGPSSCPLAPGERVCENVAKAVLEDVPNEICDLVPQKVCNKVTKLVPKLVPKRKCVNEPNEVCIR